MLVELRRRTWIAALRLAVLLSSAAALVAVVVSSWSDVPHVAVVLPVIVVAFVASWIQTERVRRELAQPVMVRSRHLTGPSA